MNTSACEYHQNLVNKVNGLFRPSINTHHTFLFILLHTHTPHSSFSLHSPFHPSFLRPPSTHRKECRFQLSPTLSVRDVVAEIRKQTGLHDETPFNLKWLDVEGKGEELEGARERERREEVE